jgi:hypothetical protein
VLLKLNATETIIKEVKEKMQHFLLQKVLVLIRPHTGREGNYEGLLSPPPKKFTEIYIYKEIVVYHNLQNLFQRNNNN